MLRIPLTPHVLLALTLTGPELGTPVVPHVTVMLLVPCPVIFVPFVTVQLYIGTGTPVGFVTLKPIVAPEHHDGVPGVIVPGVAGFPLIVIVRGVLVPGEQCDVLAVTLTNPEVKVEFRSNCIVSFPCPTKLVPGTVHV